MKSSKKSADDGDGDVESEGGVIDSAAENVIIDEAFRLLLLVLRRATATFQRVRHQSLWGSTGTAVISRVRDSLTKVFVTFVLCTVWTSLNPIWVLTCPFCHLTTARASELSLCAVLLCMLLGPLHGAIAVPSVTRCHCRRHCRCRRWRRGHRCAGGVRQYSGDTW